MLEVESTKDLNLKEYYFKAKHNFVFTVQQQSGVPAAGDLQLAISTERNTIILLLLNTI